MDSCRFDGRWLAPNASQIAFTCPAIKQKDVGTTTTQAKKKKIIETKLERSVKIETGRVELTLPLITVSEGNCFEPWQKKAQRHKAQHSAIWHAMLTFKQLLQLPCTITCIRVGPRFLDEHDNLRMAFKYIVDALSEELTGKKNGKGDNDPRLTWKYSQEKSKAKGVKILFEF